jgi:hypothetical protein
LPNSTYTFYLVSPSVVVFVEIGSTGETEGLANLQTGAPFVPNSSLSGTFGFASVGVVSGAGIESVGRVLQPIYTRFYCQ